MKLRLLSVGTRAPGWVRDAFTEYARRMPPDMPLELIEISAPKHQGDKARFIQAEGDKMSAQIDSSDWVVALDEGGRQVTSVQLAGKLDDWRMQGSNVVFAVGGADGLSPAIRERANEQMALSSLTFPHYMVRVIVAEAVYRAWSICSGHPYHRE